MWNWINNTDPGRAVRSYVVSFVTTDLKSWLAAGLAAVLPVVVTALNKSDPRYGLKNDE
jgi:hypothetical protein